MKTKEGNSNKLYIPYCYITMLLYYLLNQNSQTSMLYLFQESKTLLFIKYKWNLRNVLCEKPTIN